MVELPYLEGPVSMNIRATSLEQKISLALDDRSDKLVVAGTRKYNHCHLESTRDCEKSPAWVESNLVDFKLH